MVFAIVGFTIIMVASVQYLLTIAKETVPESVAPLAISELVGLAFGVVGMALEPSVLTIGLFVMGGSMAGLLLYFLSIRMLPDGDLIANVDAPMPPLVATDHAGQPFDLNDLRGKRVMFKFFRGSW
jgi:hypothetical protein